MVASQVLKDVENEEKENKEGNNMGKNENKGEETQNSD